MRVSYRAGGLLAFAAAAVLLGGAPGRAEEPAEFRSAWPAGAERVWVGPEYWANRLQDWRVSQGRLECTTSGGNRNVALLARQLGTRPGTLEMHVRLGRLGQGRGWAGFRIGAKGPLFAEPSLADWRDNAVRGLGLEAGLTTEGRLFLGRAPHAQRLKPRGVSRESWRLKHVDSSEGETTAGQRAFDGDPGTIWHTKFGAPPYPHEIQIDLGHTIQACGFVYVPRQENVIGRIRHFEFFTSTDGEDWGEPVAQGELANSADPQEIRFPCQAARYVRLLAKSDHAARPAAAIAELYILDEASIQEPAAPADAPEAGVPTDDVVLRLTAQPAGETYRVTLAALDARGEKTLATLVRLDVPALQLVGGLQLVCDADVAAGPARGQRFAAAGDCRFWFRDWIVAGSKLTGDDSQRFGPILWTQYTLSGGVLKLTAQMPPIGPHDSQPVRLEIEREDGWKEAGQARIDPLARTATFRVEPWDSTRDVRYRAVYAWAGADGQPSDDVWAGVVRRDPTAQETITVAGFTGNSDPAWPNVDFLPKLLKLNPDVVFFSGDQIYENVAGYGIEREPLDRATLDYLRKWYFYGWSFRELLRDRPSVSIPDDHDVYHGNLWGEGGERTDDIDTGGYLMDPAWVNMVQRTQTSHLPDPPDATPVKNEIGVYYCPMTYGRVSFAVIEDRKWKSGPKGLVPPRGPRSDWIDDPQFNPKSVDLPQAELLGERQLRFLRDWAADWRGADFKVVLSQTVFANAATHHGPDLKYLVADHDSNGWPQSKRNLAVDAMRRGFAFHLAGDQHLATLIHHGIDEFDDANWSLAVPSVTNFYMRAWQPRQPGKPLAPNMPAYTGRFRDGFGNPVSVWAATNPGPAGVEPAWLHDKKPGFGLIRLHKRTGQITVECWPRAADPTDPQAKQFEGWPKTIDRLDNYGRAAAAYLPTLRVTGVENPVVQVAAQPSGEIVYTVRIVGQEYRPKVFAEDQSYTVHVGEPGTAFWKTLRDVRPVEEGVLEVNLYLPEQPAR